MSNNAVKIFLLFSMIVSLSGCLGGDEATPPPTESPDLVAMGQQLYTTKQCRACHTIDGTPSTGPSFKGVFGSTVMLSGGDSIVVDEAYLKESILYPDAKVVEGFRQGIMQGFIATLDISDEEADALVAYIKTL